MKGFSNIAKGLPKLTEKGSKFKWNDDNQEAFERLKSFLITSPVLACPSNEGDLLLDTDASNYGANAVLLQIQIGEERVISYFSKSFSKSERYKERTFSNYVSCKTFSPLFVRAKI